MTAITALNPQTVIVHPDALSPLAGMTIEKALIANSALAGLPVEVFAPNSHDTRPTRRYVFSRIVLPGDWRDDPFQSVGDVVLVHADADLRPRWGIMRVLSAVLIKRITVLAASPCRTCETCGAVLLRTEKIYDTARLGDYVLSDGDFEWSHRFECTECWYS